VAGSRLKVLLEEWIGEGRKVKVEKGKRMHYFNEC
jgi:hypothetical protein